MYIGYLRYGSITYLRVRVRYVIRYVMTSTEVYRVYKPDLWYFITSIATTTVLSPTY